MNNKFTFSKIFLLAVLIAATVVFSGCGDRIDLEDRNYIMGLGIDLTEEGYEFTYGFPDLAALTGKGENIHYPVTTVKGKSIDDATAAYGRKANKRLDYGQLQTIVLGRTLIENEEMMEKILYEIKESQEFSRTIFVCVANDTAAEIIDLDESVNGAIGVYIKDMFENNHQMLGYEKITINELIIGLSNPDRHTQIACIDADYEENIPVIIDNLEITGFSLQ